MWVTRQELAKQRSLIENDTMIVLLCCEINMKHLKWSQYIVSTKSEVIYQRALQFQQLVKEISIKHYANDQTTYAHIIDAIFSDIFRDEIENRIRNVNWNGQDERRDGDGGDRRDDDNDNCNPM
jgi:hypothetical protein